MKSRILLAQANATHIPLADGSVHCVVTSPPYYGLRDYGTARWDGGDPECNHMAPPVGGVNGSTLGGASQRAGHSGDGQYRSVCDRCGARRIDEQIGMEATPEKYVARMVEVFREVWRVLRDDGVLFLNLGDSYVSNSAGANPSGFADGRANRADRLATTSGGNLRGKNLLGIPWRVAFALQADGWYLRQDCIWHKPNPMPESVRDRCTKSHEYVFLLTKSARYYFDADAISEPASDGSDRWGGKTMRLDTIKSFGGDGQISGTPNRSGRTYEYTGRRNRRSVWTITSQPYAGAHFATMPPTLAELCVQAGSSEHGCCSACGAPWEREVERGLTAHDGASDSLYSKGSTANRLALLRQAARERGEEYANQRRTIGWQPACACNVERRPCVVFDPFTGSGTTVMVAQKLGRIGVGIDLSHRYLVENAKERTGLGEMERLHGFTAAAHETRKPDLPLNELPLFERIR